MEVLSSAWSGWSGQKLLQAIDILDRGRERMQSSWTCRPDGEAPQTCSPRWLRRFSKAAGLFDCIVCWSLYSEYLVMVTAAQNG